MREDNVRKIWSEAELDAALEDLHGAEDAGDGLAFARATLMTAAGIGEAPPTGPRRSGAWRWLAAAAAVVILAGGLGVAAALRTPEASRPAAALPDLDRPLAPGEYHYTDMRELTYRPVDGYPGKIRQRVELWIPADPTGVWHRRTTVTGLPAAPGKLAAPLPGPVDEYGPGGVLPGLPDYTGTTKPKRDPRVTNWLSPDAAFVASLVPDPQKLLTRLRFDPVDNNDLGRSGAHLAGQSLAMARSALETGLLRPDVRFALRDALAEVPGIAVTHEPMAPDNRPATVYLAKDIGLRLFLDPATARLLAVGSSPIPVVTHNNEVPRSTARTSESLPVTTQFPLSPDRPDAPDTLYSYAITTAAG